MSVKPVILFVPGLWEGPTVFDRLRAILQPEYQTFTTSLKSTGTKSPGNPSMADDIRGIHDDLARLVNQGHEVLLVMHSAGGFLGSAAMYDLVLSQRVAQGKTGGVKHALYIAAGLLPKGMEHPSPPFLDIQGDICLCKDPRQLLLNDVSDEDAAKALQNMQHQPARGWNDSVSYVGWDQVPSTYVIADNDQALPASLQEQFASMANSTILHIDSGHTPMLSRPQDLADIILRLA